MKSDKFEVGKFYRVHLRPAYDPKAKGIPAMVVRMTKTKIVFEYLYRSKEGVSKELVDRRLAPASTDKGEEAYEPGTWSCIRITTPADICEKPSAWDSVPECKERR